MNTYYLKPFRWLLTVFIVVTSTAMISSAQSVSGLESKLSRIKEYKTQIEKNDTKIRGLNQDKNQEIYKLGVEMSNLYAEKQKVLDEMRSGYYCNRCWRSKTQIEQQTGKTFSFHLNKVNGDRVSAPQDKIDAKAAEYDAKIKKVRDRKYQLENEWTEYDDKIKYLKQESEKIEQQKIPAAQENMRAEADGWRDKRRKQLLKDRASNMEAALAMASKVGNTEKTISELKSRKDRYNEEYMDRYQKMVNQIEQQYDRQKSTLEGNISTKDQEIYQHQQMADQQQRSSENNINQLNQEVRNLEKSFNTAELLTDKEKTAYQNKIDSKKNLLANAQLDLQKMQDYNRQKDYTLRSEKQMMENNLSTIISEKPQTLSTMQQELDNAFEMKEKMIDDAISGYQSVLARQKDEAYDAEMARYNKSKKLQDDIRSEVRKVESLCSEGDVDFKTNSVVYANEDAKREHYYKTVRDVMLSVSRPCSSCPSYKELVEEGEDMQEITRLLMRYTASGDAAKEYERKDAKEHTDTQFDILTKKLEKRQ